MDELRYDLERDAVRVVLTDGGGRVLLFHVRTPDEHSGRAGRKAEGDRRDRRHR